jgi:hypothetical protein
MLTLPSNVAKASPLTFSLNKSAVLAAATDAYWQDGANVKSVIVVYRSTAGNQRKRLEFDFTQATPTATATWTGTARADHDIEQIVLVDFDGDTYSIPSANLPSGKGVGFGGGGVTPPIVAPVVHNYQPNGAVNDMVTDGSNVWIGGAFTSLRFMAPYAATISATTAENQLKDQASGKFPIFNGTIHCFAFDGTDTLFVGGTFTSVNGVLRNSIAKLNRVSGSWIPDNSWNSLFIERPFKTSSNAQAGIYSIFVSENVIYFGGNFSSYTAPGAASVSANHLVGINKLNGALICSISPVVAYGAGKYPTAILEDSGYLYVAFNTGQPVKINKLTGVTDSAFAPNVTNALVSKMALALQGESVFIGGCFSSIGGVTKYNIAKVNKNTGALDASFSVPQFTAATASSNIRSVVIDSSGNLIVAGVFDNLANLGRNIVKLNSQTGARISDFNAQSTFFAYNGSSVECLLISGNSLYGFGNFTGQPTGATNPQTGVNLAKVDVTTGAIITEFNGTESRLTSAEAIKFAAFDGQNILIAGDISAYGGYARQGVAKLTKDADGNWKVVEAFNTASGGTAVNTLALSGNDLYIGGTFTTWAGSARNRVAKLNATTGSLDPSFGVGVFTSGLTTGQFNGVSDSVNDFAFDTANNEIVIGGEFSTYSKKSSASSTTSPATPRWIRVNISTNTEIVPTNGASQGIYGVHVDGGSYYFTFKRSSSLATWGSVSVGNLVKTDNMGIRDTNFAIAEAHYNYVSELIGDFIFVTTISAAPGIYHKVTGTKIGTITGIPTSSEGEFIEHGDYVYAFVTNTPNGGWWARWNKITQTTDTSWTVRQALCNRGAVIVENEVIMGGTTTTLGGVGTVIQPREKLLAVITLDKVQKTNI